MNFYPRPPRGGRQLSNRLWLGRLFISIPALREEGDSDVEVYVAGDARFLSTPSARRATYVCSDWQRVYCISIHALREEGDLRQAFQVQKYYISIHALREEGDQGTVDIAQATPISIHALREEGDVEGNKPEE